MNEKNLRHYSLIDRICLQLDNTIRALTGHVHHTNKAYPASLFQENTLSDQQKKISAGLMRVNHAGEICAQALYHGQGFITHMPAFKQKFEKAALEEGDHLIWCKKRLDELHAHTSYLNPIWYTLSFWIGVLAGIAGDRWSLGFLAETEKQVVKHLQGHLETLKNNDPQSFAIIQQMEEDEMRHHMDAVLLGAHELPKLIQNIMALSAKVMVTTSYWL